MQLIESIETINYWLEKNYGKTDNNLSNWRVVFSENQFEKRLGTYNDFTTEGIFIRQITEVREVPKYNQWIREKYVLEKLTIIPEFQSDELPVERLSYEPIWIFEDKQGNYLPPRIDACKFIIEQLQENSTKSFYPKYKDPDSDPEDAIYNQKKRIDDIQEQLFGNETEAMDALKYKEGIVVPHKGNGEAK